MAVETGTPSPLGLSISVVSSAVFASNVSSMRWSVRAVIGGVDVSDRIEGVISVTAAEDSARVAMLSVAPANAAEYAGYDGQEVTIDVQINSGAGWDRYRIFTGVIKRKVIDPSTRRCELECRDGYQEIQAACQSAQDVEELFSGLAYPCPSVLPWDESKPDPVSYFSGLLDTLPGSCAISSNGLWRAYPWSIVAPAASFTLADTLDGSVKLISADRADLPRSVKAMLTHRFYRLHNVEVQCYWAAPPLVDYPVRDIKLVPRSVVLSAVEAVSNWYIKGKLEIEAPPIGNHAISWGGTSTTFPIYEPDSNLGIWSILGWFYRRWYQEIEVTYTSTLAMGGTSDRDDVISSRMVADWDAGAWESPKVSDTPLSIYQRNVPVPPTGPTGYEALVGPWPPQNGHLDYYGDITTVDVESAMGHVMAKAVRRVISGKRRQRVNFSRPIDPRFEIGDCISFDFFGLSGTGQIAELRHELDCDTGDAITHFRLSCPSGNAADPGFTVNFTPHSATVSHSLPGLGLGNYYGSASDTGYIAPPNDADLAGYFCNTGGLSEYFDITAPVYNEQFRIVLPEISASVRDPIKVDEVVPVTISVPDSNLTIDF